ncbi:MAG: MMPL family transporter [Gemmatimonadales bacterium]
MKAGKPQISAWLVTHRYRTIGVWVVLAALLAPAAARVKQELSVTATVPGSESAHVEELVATRFASGFAQYAVLVIDGAPSPRNRIGREFLSSLRDTLAVQPFVSRTFSYLDVPDTMFIGSRGETFLIAGLKSTDGRIDDVVPRLRAVTERIAARSSISNLSLRWTGETPLNHDLRSVSASDAKDAERRVMPVTLILLVVAFGAVAAALLPLLSAGLAITLALGAAVAVSRVWPLSILLQNVVAMLGLGLGIDYALLVVGRFRESLNVGMTPANAAMDAASKAGHTIVLSGASVAIGFVALLAIPVNEIRSLAVGGLLVIVIAVLIATTLLPVLLSMLGSRVNWGRIRRSKQTSGSERWRAWGRFVCHHPLIVLFAAGIPTGLLAFQSTRLSSDLPRGDWLPPSMESARALQSLSNAGRSGVVNSIRIVVSLPDGNSWDSPSGWAAVKNASDRLSADSRVARVRSLTTVTGMIAPNLTVIAALPATVRDALTSRDGKTALVEIMPSETAGQSGAMDLVRELRGRRAADLTGLAGTRLDVGGLPAFNVDYESAIGDRFFSVVIAVVLVTMIALMIGFRSVLIAMKAVALNLLSVAAAFGAVVLVFQDGHGIRLLGLSSPLNGTFTAIPIIVFCVVFGLSMDYEVFLVARVAEARRNGLDDSEAIAEGLARTGGLITSAAAIMIAVFAAFTIGDFVIIKILGFALAVAVLVDATVMRVAIGPALLSLAGRWNWWPGDLNNSNRYVVAASSMELSRTKSASSPLDPTPTFAKIFER